MNAIEPPSVLTDKLTPDKDSIRWALEVQGTFLEKLGSSLGMFFLSYHNRDL